MKTLFIPTIRKLKANEKKILEISEKLPKNIVIAYSIQYEILAKQISKILSKNKKHNITKIIQVLGCSNINSTIQKNTQAILLISDGKFHAISLALNLNTKNRIPIYILERNNLIKLSEEDIAIFKKKKKAAYLKFLNSDKVGILISLKPGQQALKKAFDIKKTLNKLEEFKNKDIYLFLADNINIEEFENFNIDSWLNTACPQLSLDDAGSSILNVEDIDF